MDPFWFESYRSNRTQSVRLSVIMSNKTSISYGVPQGSVLGPIIFNIHVNDLAPFLPNCEFIQYADDTQIILFSSNIDNLKKIIKKAEDTLKLINQSKGAYTRGRVASPTLRRQTRGFLRASLHAGSLPILSNVWQNSSTCSSHEICGRPLGRLHTGLSRTDTTRWAESTSG